MNIDIDKMKEDLGDALLVPKERCDLIRSALTRITAHYRDTTPQGSIAEILRDAMIQCQNLNEVVYTAYVIGDWSSRSIGSRSRNPVEEILRGLTQGPLELDDIKDHIKRSKPKRR